MNTNEEKNLIRVVDGNEAACDIAYRTNEICVIYPITPSSGMGELSDQWSFSGRKNYKNTVPEVIEMQSEGGVAGAVHGAIQTGSLVTTFTSSQGLLLMIPNMYRIAAELTPTVFHVAARTVATQGMSIYCDHSDVMATRMTGFAMLCSANVQEAHDMALICQAASLKSRIPFLHFFDGFRTSHEIGKISYITDEVINMMIDDEDVIEHRKRRMSPENPFVRGVIYNSDIFFQEKESVSIFYENAVKTVKELMKRFEKLTGRSYDIIEYFGDKDAERILILMGSGAETAIETVSYMEKQGLKVGVIKIRLFQPFSSKDLIEKIPQSCKSIVVLDRTKEAGSGGEPLYQKVSTAVLDAYSSGVIKNCPKILGGRFGIAGKEFTPAMIKAIFDELDSNTLKNQFTVGIEDDSMHSSIKYDESFETEDKDVIKALFYGLGSDGTVGANKNSIKIIGEETDLEVQAHFVYDSRKSGSKTVSHLRFGKNKIRSEYLIRSANFVGCHQFDFVNQTDVLEFAAKGATFLLNSPYSSKDTWNHIPDFLKCQIKSKKINCYVIDADKVAEKTGMGKRINTIMQTCFFALSEVLPKNEAIEKIKQSISKTYFRKGEEIVKKNFEAVDYTLQNLHEMEIPLNDANSYESSEFQDIYCFNDSECVMKKIMNNQGEQVKVSELPPDGTFATETTKLEKRNLSAYAPVWDPEICIQCGKCSLVCPHSAIRVKSCDGELLKDAPNSFKYAPLRGKDSENKSFILQVYPEYCTGCGLCQEACPLLKEKAIKLELKEPRAEEEKNNVEFFEELPAQNREKINSSTMSGVQFLNPMFEFCGACAGCGESAYVKLITQLFADRLIIANACGCSSVYGGSLPNIPWTKNSEGRGPSWSSSLFEDNAEFGFGFRLTEDKLYSQAIELLFDLQDYFDHEFINELVNSSQRTEEEINKQRKRVSILKEKLKIINNDKSNNLLSIADYFVKHSIWAIGGDGWAYDIGFGGLDHVIASGRNVNMLVLDTEVYSNTGGQASKATSRGSVVKFASNGKSKCKKDLGMMAMSYGDVYVASIALGANPVQAIKALKEAENYDGPSLVIAYSHCIAHGIDMKYGLNQQDLAVKSGYWLLYRYNPDLAKQGLNPLQLDSKPPSISFEEYAKNENRFRILSMTNPKQSEELMKLSQEDIMKRWSKYESLARK